MEVALQTRCTFSVLTSSAGVQEPEESSKDGLSQVVSDIAQALGKLSIVCRVPRW